MSGLETRLDKLLEVRARNGAQTNRLEAATTRLDQMTGALTNQLSETEDADIAKTLIQFNSQNAAYQAALAPARTSWSRRSRILADRRARDPSSPPSRNPFQHVDPHHRLLLRRARDLVRRMIEFAAGLIGLCGRRYAIVATDDSASSWPHSIDEPKLALPVTTRGSSSATTRSTCPTMRLADRRRRGRSRCLDDVPRGAELSDFYANLRAPILIAEGQGHQVINESADAPVRAPLFPAVAAAA